MGWRGHKAWGCHARVPFASFGQALFDFAQFVRLGSGWTGFAYALFEFGDKGLNGLFLGRRRFFRLSPRRSELFQTAFRLVGFLDESEGTSSALDDLVRGPSGFAGLDQGRSGFQREQGDADGQAEFETGARIKVLDQRLRGGLRRGEVVVGGWEQEFDKREKQAVDEGSGEVREHGAGSVLERAMLLGGISYFVKGICAG
jgi:hypothetical protein